MKILIICHEASLTGAPLVAYRMAESLSMSNEVCILYMNDGPVLNLIKPRISIIKYYQNENSLFERVLNKILNRLLKNKSQFISSHHKKINSFNPDLVILNSVASIPFLFQGKLISRKIIIYIHEMPFAINRFFKKMGYKLELFNLLKISKFLVVNNITKDFFVNEIAIPKDKIEILEPSIDDSFFVPQFLEFKYHILLSGQGGWTKGTDLVSQLSFHLQYLCENKQIRIAWVGEVEWTYIDQISYELNLAGVTNCEISFLGVLTDIKTVISESKIFISLSRADAMQTACIEAMALGKPIICFRGSGGIASLIENKCGLVVAYPDLNKFAESILYLLDDQVAYNRMSEKAKELAKQFCIQKKGNELGEVLKKDF